VLPHPQAAARGEFLSQDASGGVHVAAKPSAPTSATTVAAATEQEPAAAENPAAADPVGWEFRLTADRRRILVAVNPTAHLEFV
jgi:hypothetical protein